MTGTLANGGGVGQAETGTVGNGVGVGPAATTGTVGNGGGGAPSATMGTSATGGGVGPAEMGTLGSGSSGIIVSLTMSRLGKGVIETNSIKSHKRSLKPIDQI